MSTQLALESAVFAVEARYGAEAWERIAWFLYFDQAHLFVGALQKRDSGWDYRVVEIEAAT